MRFFLKRQHSVGDFFQFSIQRTSGCLPEDYFLLSKKLIGRFTKMNFTNNIERLFKHLMDKCCAPQGGVCHVV